MASLKDLKNRIGSVKSTQKITKAMKMVAAAKLRRAREAAENSRPYAQRMEAMVAALAAGVAGNDDAPLLMSGNKESNKHLIVIATSDRGLCGGFNSSIVRATRTKIHNMQAQGKDVSIYFVGRKGREQMEFEFGHLVVGKIENIAKKTIKYKVAQTIAEEVTSLYKNDGFGTCEVVYNHFKSAIAQEVTFQQLIPLELPKTEIEPQPYEYEPSETQILEDLLPRNLAIQIFKSLLENGASEQGSRMTAMDNATSNAGDMIDRLSLQYNRSRQAAITTELVEIISGAEAL